MKRGLGSWIVLLLLLYAAGLTRDLTEPWVGMHDWNGAFFSQLARNCLRYPSSLHHGMPVVAVGAAAPAPGEYALYATHPPGLVWLLAGAFRVCGESEAVARLVPIGASLASLALLVWLAARAYGTGTALVGGAIYALMPMSVYFGRMVDHEAICLMSMLGMAAAWSRLTAPATTPRGRRAAFLDWTVLLMLGVWVDWSAVLFAVLFGLALLRRFRCGAISRRLMLATAALVFLVIGGMVTHLVYAGLEGHWADLAAIFVSRSVEGAGGALRDIGGPRGDALTLTIENLSGPVLLLTAVGIGVVLRDRLAAGRESARSPSADPTGPTGAGLRVSPPPDISAAARMGLRCVGLTGLVWVLVFWRQYERHHYWLFYLGPAAAVLSARALIAVWSRLRSRGAPAAHGVVGLILAGTAAVEILGAGTYFERRGYPPAAVEDWQRIRAMTSEGERVLLFRNPYRIELRGDYRFRNIVPPQLAYYLDRPMAVERDFDRVAERAGRFAVFVMPARDAQRFESAWRPALAAFRPLSLTGQVVIDLRARAPRAAAWR